MTRLYSEISFVVLTYGKGICINMLAVMPNSTQVTHFLPVYWHMST